ncbi:MAG TPA: hypothetical protein VHC43_11230 [Mycobacteriales bacterium]|nr:hypothetical protein [Mycobacteriales bacterium]
MRGWITAIVGTAVLGVAALPMAGAVPMAGASPAHTTAHAARPTAENVPTSVAHVRIAFRDLSDTSQNRTVVLHGRHARHLVALFDALKREPSGTVHCDAMSSSHTAVTFRGTTHKWVATEAICTNVPVTRDGKQEPTLLPSSAWDGALTHYIGHSPTAPGNPATPG